MIFLHSVGNTLGGYKDVAEKSKEHKSKDAFCICVAKYEPDNM